MYLKIEMNEQEDIDLDFKGTDRQAVIMFVTAMQGSDQLYKLIKKAVEVHEEIGNKFDT